MKKIIIILIFNPLVSLGKKIKGKKILTIKAAVGEWQSSVGEYLNLKTIFYIGLFQALAIIPGVSNMPLSVLHSPSPSHNSPEETWSHVAKFAALLGHSSDDTGVCKKLSLIHI